MVYMDFDDNSHDAFFNGGKFSCYLIGEDSMADRCVRAIVEEGHHLLGICTPNKKLALFAEQHRIPCTNSLKIFESWIENNGCDFLFSVVNKAILSKTMISLPRKFCINFHNAPLPKYAGVHATQWAIINNEKLHGTTWHVLEEGIDTGDILKQDIFAIDPHETGFSLNVKCVEYGMSLFTPLLKELADGTYKRTKQDLAQRSYYTFYQKPKNFGVISWNSMTAEEIYDMYRSMNFSEYTNTLCLPKFVYKNTIFFAKRVSVLNKKSKADPGTIVEISDEYQRTSDTDINISKEYLRIATLTNDIAISQIADIDNKSYETIYFTTTNEISVGQQLSSLDPMFLKKLQEHAEILAKFESYWVHTLERANSLNFLSLNISELENNGATSEKIIFSDKSIHEKISKSFHENVSYDTALITIFLLYIYRLNNYDDYTIGYKSKYLDQSNEDIRNFFAEIVPMNISFSAEINFSQAFALVSKQLDITINKNTFSKDIKQRYPQLSDNTLSLQIVISSSEPKENNNRCLFFVINNEGIKLYFPSDLDELNSKIVENIPGHLQVFIDGILQNINIPVKDIPILTESENQLLIEEYNNTISDYPRNSSIAEIFEEQALKYPNNIAVKHGSDFLTYDELNKKANQLASHLISLGVSKESIVAIYSNKGINSILSILAVVKSGAAYTSIDSMYPKDYIKHLVKDTGALILLTQEKDRRDLEKSLPSGKFIILSVDNPELKCEIFNNTSDENLSLNIEASSIAYVMYTSGSTGNPKGVMIPNRAVVRLVKNTNYIQFEPSDRIAQASSISFDAATLEIWGALLNGASLILADTSTITNAEKFSRFLSSENITILWLTSALFDQLASTDNGMFRNLRYLLAGGDVLNVESVYRVIRYYNGSPANVLNGYGPTEDTTFTAVFSIPKNFDRSKSVPIGKPISNTSIYVLDKYLNLMPMGIAGELCAGGDGLAVGYLNKKELTEEKFIEIVLNGKNVRLYKTGDLVRWIPSGDLGYICRIDNQVKVRGFRIELDAIELCLLNSKLINQCGVVVQQDEKKRKTIVAYLVFKKKKDIAQIRKFLSKHLPNYMIPNVFIAIDSLPQTTNGKVDKKELLLKFKENFYKSDNYVAPRNELENKLVDIWKELLNLNMVGVTDDFFDLGGYSLLITEMIVRVKGQFNAEFSLTSFLESPTIESLSRLICSENIKYSGNSSVMLQFKNDVFLDPKIKPIDSKPLETKRLQQNVFLTGVTGFLGVYLLNDLYKLTKGKIYCLVRGNNIEDAKHRLKKTVKKYQLDDVLFRDTSRIEVVLGDLSEPNLGIQQQIFDKLSEEIDVIYHCGANVHHLYNYEALQKANVLSTLEIVKLATNKKNKHINYVSTLSAIAAYSDKTAADFPNEHDIKLDELNGYAQTKLASEIILTKAHKRGISVSIYRPSWIIGNTDGKYYDLKNNHLLLFLKGCVQIGYAPKLSAKISTLPVDFVSSFIVKTFINGENGVFNVFNPFTVTWDKLIEKINENGYKVSAISPVAWYRDYFSKIDEWNAAYKLLPLYSDGGLGWAKAQNMFLKADVKNVKSAVNTVKLKKIDVLVNNCLSFFKLAS